ncbi:MAG: PLP-dependent aspartate aminotransferase family protein [Bdellovibrionaceae bacterium]|nr:PLP-dependent aspartate aminotransferase family protein [Pseudobdellovibrionaceae bacterium]MDW8190168.1 PLP-dependent aspartate aminotransferase family protein [Pseudobdellovibrionaceae bacterium]
MGRTASKTSTKIKSSNRKNLSRKNKHPKLPVTKSIAEYKNPLRQYHPATSVILAGYRSGLSEFSVKPPLFRTSTFEFVTSREGEKFFQRAYHLKGDDGKEPGLIYSRLNNPNVEIIEDKLVAAEKGSHYALLFPSGMSAITTTILALIPKGGRILYTDPVYGGSYLFFKDFCPKRFDIQTHPVDATQLKLLETHLKQLNRLDLFYIETPANPTMRMVDIEACRLLVKKYFPNCLVAVDNTFLGPVFQSPFEFGVDLVFYSATKFLGGHSDLIAGVALFAEKSHYIATRDYRTILGNTPAPDTAWLLTRSIETLWVRMERQAEKASKIVNEIYQHPKIKWVGYPGLLEKLAKRQPSKHLLEQLKIYHKQCKGPGSMFSFELKNSSRQASYRFLDHLRIFHLAVSLGGTESLIQHPRSMTHSDMSPEDLDRAQITEGLIRVSVGLESSDDLIQDIYQALEWV